MSSAHSPSLQGHLWVLVQVATSDCVYIFQLLQLYLAASEADRWELTIRPFRALLSSRKVLKAGLGVRQHVHNLRSRVSWLHSKCAPCSSLLSGSVECRFCVLSFLRRHAPSLHGPDFFSPPAMDSPPSIAAVA